MNALPIEWLRVRPLHFRDVVQASRSAGKCELDAGWLDGVVDERDQSLEGDGPQMYAKVFFRLPVFDITNEDAMSERGRHR